MAIMVEKISALTFRVSNMKVSVQFYRDVLGMELLYGGETAGFSSLRAKHAESAILNLEEANTVTQWGRLIFYVADVDEVWRHLRNEDLIRRSHKMRCRVAPVAMTTWRPLQPGKSCLTNSSQWPISARAALPIWEIRDLSLKPCLTTLCLDAGTRQLGHGPWEAPLIKRDQHETAPRAQLPFSRE